MTEGQSNERKAAWRRAVVFLVGLLLAVATLACVRGERRFVAEDWSVEWVERRGQRGAEWCGVYIDMALDESGDPHMVCSGRRPRYATRGPDGWRITRFGGEFQAGDQVSLVVDKQGHVHIGYDVTVDHPQREVRYVSVIGGEMREELISQGNTVFGSSLALHPSGQPVMAYGYGRDETRFSQPVDGRWQTTMVVTNSTVIQLQMAIDESDGLWLLREDNSYPAKELHVLHHVGDTQSSEVVYRTMEDRVALDISMAIGHDGQPRIAFTEYWEEEFTYGVRQDDRWDLSSVNMPAGASKAAGPALAVGPQGRVYMCYTATYEGTSTLFVAWLDGDMWQSQAVEQNGDLSYLCAVDIDRQGGVHLMYAVGEACRIKYAYHPPFQ